ELAVPARLLLVAAALHDLPADGFRVADARRAPLDRDPVAVREPFGRNAQVHLALPPGDDLVGLRIVVHSERRVFLDQLVEREAELHVVLAILGGNRDREDRSVWLHLADRRMRLLARREGIPGLGVIELAERHRLAGRRRAALGARRADQVEHAGHTARPGLPPAE